MKNYNHIITVACWLYTTVLFGQNNINRNNYFTLGNSYPYVFLDSIKRDTAIISGNNVVWDFSNSVQTSQFDTLHAIDPSTTIFYNDPNVNYNISNLCLYEPLGMSFPYDDSLYSNYISDSSTIYFVGSWAYNGIWESWYYHLTDTEKYFAFPFSYNDNFLDSFFGTALDMSGSGLHTIQGTRSVEADGFGTLILPSATYLNCLRIKSVRDGSDSFMFGTNYFTRTFYTWFQLNTNGFILEMETDSIWIWQTKYYYDNPLINGLNELAHLNSIFIYPNPCNGNLSITFSPIINNGAVEIYNILGEKIFEENINMTATKEIKLKNVSTGIYFVRVFVGERSYCKKLIVE